MREARAERSARASPISPHPEPSGDMNPYRPRLSPAAVDATPYDHPHVSPTGDDPVTVVYLRTAARGATLRGQRHDRAGRCAELASRASAHQDGTIASRSAATPAARVPPSCRLHQRRGRCAATAGNVLVIMPDPDPFLDDPSARRNGAKSSAGARQDRLVPLAPLAPIEAPEPDAVVGALWRLAPPGATESDRSHMLRTLAARLDEVAEVARRLVADATPEGARGMRLLADTAEVLRAALAHPEADRWQPPPVPELPWPARLRLARLERWLAARAAHEPGAMASADLCLWLAEHLEAAQH
jgi:hypothetical protein